MQTKDTPDGITALPPPPAPPARDANPWPMPDAPRPAPGPAAARRRGRPDAARPAARAGGTSMVVGIVVMIIVVGLVQARRGGELEDLAGPAMALFVLVFFALSRIHQRRRRSGRNSPGAPDG